MNQQKQIEIIKKQFPLVGETEARERLNAANKYFIRESRIIQSTIAIKIVDGVTDYPFKSLVNKAGGQLLEVLDVEDDKDNSNLLWLVEDRDTLIIGYYKDNSTIRPAPKNEVVTIVGVFSDADYGTVLTNEPNYDKEFHLAPVWRVLSELSLEEGDLNKWQAYKSEYKELEIAAKKAAGSKGIKGNYRSFYGVDPYIPQV